MAPGVKSIRRFFCWAKIALSPTQARMPVLPVVAQAFLPVLFFDSFHHATCS
jgi:hypothetical protein